MSKLSGHGRTPGQQMDRFAANHDFTLDFYERLHPSQAIGECLRYAMVYPRPLDSIRRSGGPSVQFDGSKLFYMSVGTSHGGWMKSCERGFDSDGSASLPLSE